MATGIRRAFVCLFVVCKLAPAQLMLWNEVDGRTREQRVRDTRPLGQQPYLGLGLEEQADESGAVHCRVGPIMRAGPALEADSVRRGDWVLELNETAIQSARQFGQALDRLVPGSEARLKVLRNPAMWPEKPKDAVEVVTLRVASRADWATPLDMIRPAGQRVKPEELIPPGVGPTALERFLDPHLNRFRLRQPLDDLRKYLALTVDRFYGANMLSRVAYAFLRPTRLAELQSSITGPLARIVDQNTGNPWVVGGHVLTQAAKNVDSPFVAGTPGWIDMAQPAQALKDASGMVGQAYAHLDRAFAKLGAAQLAEMETALPALLVDATRRSPPAMRARMASVAIDYASLFAAAAALASWSPVGGPPAAEQGVAVPRELEGAVQGELLAVERIDGRWYVYGGPGRNEYDLSRIDVVIDPGGNDRYRHSGLQRPKVQLVVDWSGNDVYSSEGEIPGPASGMLGVSVIMDHAGDDRYEGGLRSCGAGLMGIGLILDHAGNDTYKGTKWSLGFGRYGFGGIVDLEDPPKVRPLGRYEYPDGSDIYQAQESSEGYGGTRGFGLILDGAGRDLYRMTGSPPVWPDRTVTYASGQGVGYGDGLWDNGGIGLLCDLAGDDRYEAGELSQGAGWLFGMGILHDRSGNDLYSGTRYSQGASAHGGIGILADDRGDDTYWGGIAGAWDLSLGLLIDRGGNDSYQGDHRVGGLARAGHQGFAWLIDLEGHDRYVRDSEPYGAPEYNTGMGQSSPNSNNYEECRCFSFSVLVDAGGTTDYYSQPDRGDAIMKATGTYNPKDPATSSFHGFFIDTKKKHTLWP